MDVLALRDRFVDDDKRYIESFVRIRDKDIDKFVREQFDSGKLWPDPIRQLSPPTNVARRWTNWPRRA
jgi:hypothetical protein